MGRFLNPRALNSKAVPSQTVPGAASEAGSAASEKARTATITTAVPAVAAFETGSNSSTPRYVIDGLTPTVSGSMMGRVGIFSLFLFFISPELNDLCRFMIGSNAYVSWIAQGLLLLAFLAGGTAGNGFGLTIGKGWVVFTLLLGLSVVFSSWPSASLSQLMSYIPRCVLFFFAICAFVVDASTVRIFVLAQILKGCLIIVICLTMGAVVGGRFQAQESAYYASANDLALGLTISAGFFFFWAVRSNILQMLIGTAGFVTSVYFLLKTESRGAFLAIVIMLLCTLVVSSKYRLRLLPILLLTPLLLVFLPDQVVHRLTFVKLDSEHAVATTNDEGASLVSQQEREKLLRRSIVIMFHHPLFGVGIGEFADAIYTEDKEQGLQTAALGTHNSYTQIGSECGIPALITYLALIGLSIKTSYRVLKRSSLDPRMETLTGAATCIVALTVGYAVGTFFYHTAYSGGLPLLTGAAAGLGQAFTAEARRLPDVNPALLEP